jgi:hypothetical protein
MAETGGGLAAYRAVGTLYNALMTALILGLVTRRGEDTAREYVFRHFRRQHLEKFLPGLQKLGWPASPMRRPARSITTIPMRWAA